MYPTSEPEPVKSSTWPKRRVSLRSSSSNPLLQTPRSPESVRYAKEATGHGLENAPPTPEAKNSTEHSHKPAGELNDPFKSTKTIVRNVTKDGVKEVVRSRKPILSIPIPPPLVRKKSGEVVKSALKGRVRSMPTTPTKFVHFGAKLEHVKLFQKEQKPESISNPVSDDEDGLSTTPRPSRSIKSCYQRTNKTSWVPFKYKIYPFER
ncbi:hypothetical protein K7432_012364 [Basidiobolus ranarum]|uniref:TPX2 central domain-containing protein n=1 Tax=Basidiobolus ranarum TaxID=34480 RepID=A0ABR2VSC8_9FUNG